jgi:hypothetical protein
MIFITPIGAFQSFQLAAETTALIFNVPKELAKRFVHRTPERV